MRRGAPSRHPVARVLPGGV